MYCRVCFGVHWTYGGRDFFVLRADGDFWLPCPKLQFSTATTTTTTTQQPLSSLIKHLKYKIIVIVHHTYVLIRWISSQKMSPKITVARTIGGCGLLNPQKCFANYTVRLITCRILWGGKPGTSCGVLWNAVFEVVYVYCLMCYLVILASWATSLFS